jgi:hypothetical protein
MKITSFEEFTDLARRGTFVPVCKEIVADLLTPVSAFLKIAEHAITRSCSRAWKAASTSDATRFSERIPF